MRTTGWYVPFEGHDPADNRNRHYSHYFEPTLWHPTGPAPHPGPGGRPQTDLHQAASRLPTGGPGPALRALNTVPDRLAAGGRRRQFFATHLRSWPLHYSAAQAPSILSELLNPLCLPHYTCRCHDHP